MKIRYTSLALLIGCSLSLPANALHDVHIANRYFDEGNTGFDTDLTYHASDISAPGTYTITSDPSLVHPGAVSFGDYHAPTSTQMMVINGPTTAGVTLWSQDLDLHGSDSEVFTFMMASWSDTNPATIALYIDDVFIENFTAPSEAGVWDYYHTSYGLTPSEHHHFELRSVSISDQGNDFVIDQIGYYVPEPSSIALLGVAAAGLLRRQKA